MEPKQIQIQVRIRGRNTMVPGLEIGGRTVTVTGKGLKIAAVRDEAFVEGEVVPDPEEFRRGLARWEVGPDLFTFSQKITDPKPKFQYRMEWDNFAVIPITTYDDWLKNRAKKDVRENLRRAKREGVEARSVPYTDEFVHGIKSIYDETEVRQGMKCWHHGKSFEDIKEVHGTYVERAEYIGAYFKEELIGFVKMVYIGNIAKTMHVISKERYFQLRPTNALIAKAVEICAEKGMAYFNYGEARFLGKKNSSLAEFKRRQGFEEMLYPRYYIPLSLKGRLALGLRLHKGIKAVLPPATVEWLLAARSWVKNGGLKRKQSAGVQKGEASAPVLGEAAEAK